MEKRKIVAIVVCLILLGAVVLSVFITLKDRQGKPRSQTTETPTSSVNKINESEFNQALQATAALDKDFDGLRDSEEQQYKTDPAEADTDGDGLNDWQEVVIFTTDPLKNDTDGDTFLDGYEVRRGFSPKGTGTLQN